MKRPQFIWKSIARDLVRRYPNFANLPQALVSISTQQICLIKQGVLTGLFPISSSRFGVGTRWGSMRTPLGVHRVAEKIGAGMPILTRFVGRQPHGTADLNPLNSISDDDVICTRILWLGGLELGYNKGGFLDSMRRYIYIHGTIDEKRIGRPASSGCLRMKNDDVCEVFDALRQNSLVYIFK